MCLEVAIERDLRDRDVFLILTFVIIVEELGFLYSARKFLIAESQYLQ